MPCTDGVWLGVIAGLRGFRRNGLFFKIVPNCHCLFRPGGLFAGRKLEDLRVEEVLACMGRPWGFCAKLEVVDVTDDHPCGFNLAELDAKHQDDYRRAKEWVQKFRQDVKDGACIFS